mgnify:FL=1
MIQEADAAHRAAARPERLHVRRRAPHPGPADDPIRDDAHAPPGAADEAALPADLRTALRLANLLDARFRLPGTHIRFGYDAIIGLIPVVGDTITALFGAWIVVAAVRLGLGPAVVARMFINLAIDWLVGLVPVLDIVLDVGFKANIRNARLLRDEWRRHAAAP